ncbi:MAG TPA: hypothetical protein DDY13_15850 [Cytophagales bacterium]|jgi:hypothetical protein|nr:hypothetical protein [Cytophagales bacterium]
MTRLIHISLLLIALAGCATSNDEARIIVDQAIKAHGGDQFDHMVLEFDFRDRHYIAERKDGVFQYHRIWRDSTGQYHDIVSNEGFTRILNGDTVNLSDKDQQKYSNSVNSVIYFALLPYGLNDKAVNKFVEGIVMIDGEPYFQVKVTFDEEGGGQDYEDEFMYWFHTETAKLDYLAYLYHVNEGGIRFRVVTNRHLAAGLLLNDYDNYKVEDLNTPLDQLPQMYEQGKLEKLSEIDLKNVVLK